MTGYIWTPPLRQGRLAPIIHSRPSARTHEGSRTNHEFISSFSSYLLHIYIRVLEQQELSPAISGGIFMKRLIVSTLVLTLLAATAYAKHNQNQDRQGRPGAGDRQVVFGIRNLGIGWTYDEPRYDCPEDFPGFLPNCIAANHNYSTALIY